MNSTELISKISLVLQHVLAKNDTLTTPISRFHARSIPQIEIHQYLSRILKYAPCSPDCFLTLFIYLERLVQIHPEWVTSYVNFTHPVYINSYNVHRLLITSCLIAVKFQSDVFYTNLHLSRVGGIPVQELNRLEIEFLLLMDFNLHVTNEELLDVHERLMHSDPTHAATRLYLSDIKEAF